MAGWVIPLRQVIAAQSSSAQNFITLGAIVQLANQPITGPRTTLVGAHTPVSAALSRFMPAIQARQAEVYLDRYWDPCAYITWGAVDDATETKLLKGEAGLSDPNRWQSGNHAWIFDLRVRQGNLGFLLETLDATIFRHCSKLTFQRVRGRQMVFTTFSRVSPSLLQKALEAPFRPWIRRRLAMADWCGIAPDLPNELAEPSIAQRVDGDIVCWHALGVAFACPSNRNATTIRQLYSGLLWPLALNQFSLTTVPGSDHELLITWAMFSERTLSDLPDRAFHPGEWNEGPHVCIMGIYWDKGPSSQHLQRVFDDLFPKIEGFYARRVDATRLNYVFVPRHSWSEFAVEICRC